MIEALNEVHGLSNAAAAAAGAIPTKETVVPSPVPFEDYNGKSETVSEDGSEASPALPAKVLEPVNQSYYNPRLDPKNFLDGPLSLNPATRLRQMLARPGIVVCSP